MCRVSGGGRGEEEEEEEKRNKYRRCGKKQSNRWEMQACQNKYKRKEKVTERSDETKKQAIRREWGKKKIRQGVKVRGAER